VKSFPIIVSFEVRRALKRRTFWLSALLFPVLIGVIIAIASSSARSGQVDQSTQVDFTFAYTDPSGLIDAPLAASMHGTKVADPAAALADVKAGRTDAFFDYPADPTTAPVQVAGADVGLFASGKYAAVARALLTRSTQLHVGDARAVDILAGHVWFDQTTYRDGQPTDGENAVVAPALLMILFFFLVILNANQGLTAFIEEKENRVAEISLTVLSPSVMLAGKVVSLLILGVIQMIVIAILPVALLASGTMERLGLGGLPFDPAHLSADPVVMTLGIVILLSAFALNMVSIITVGMIMPNARDAGSLYAPLILFAILPLYLATTIVTSPDSAVVQLVTFFPWSGGLTALLRNAVGNLPLWQTLVVIAEQLAVTGAILWFANKIARYGLISYDKALDVRAVLRRASTQASAGTRSV